MVPMSSHVASAGAAAATSAAFIDCCDLLFLVHFGSVFWLGFFHIAIFVAASV